MWQAGMSFLVKMRDEKLEKSRKLELIIIVAILWMNRGKPDTAFPVGQARASF